MSSGEIEAESRQKKYISTEFNELKRFNSPPKKITNFNIKDSPAKLSLS
jgi:hypothetical protein